MQVLRNRETPIPIREMIYKKLYIGTELLMR